jgi:hypothetical protein
MIQKGDRGIFDGFNTANCFGSVLVFHFYLWPGSIMFFSYDADSDLKGFGPAFLFIHLIHLRLQYRHEAGGALGYLPGFLGGLERKTEAA